MSIVQPRKALLEQLARYAYQWSPEAVFPLVSGQMSNEYLDCKKALGQPETMANLGPVVLGMLRSEVVAIGGLTMGADPIAMSACQTSARADHKARWFSVRKEPKKHGLQKLIEGCVERDEPVAVVDDVVTTGGSTVQAIVACRDFGLRVVQVIVLVDRQQSEGLAKIERAAGFKVDVICTKGEIADEWHRQHALR